MSPSKWRQFINETGIGRLLIVRLDHLGFFSQTVNAFFIYQTKCHLHWFILIFIITGPVKFKFVVNIPAGLLLLAVSPETSPLRSLTDTLASISLCLWEGRGPLLPPCPSALASLESKLTDRLWKAILMRKLSLKYVNPSI